MTHYNLMMSANRKLDKREIEPERMTNEEITKSIKEIKEMLVYIGTYGHRADDTPMDVRIRVKEIVDRWKNEGDMNK